MDAPLGKTPAQMLAEKAPPPGQKMTLLSLDPPKPGVKVQLPNHPRTPQPGVSTVPPGVTLTVSPNPQLTLKSCSLTSAPGPRLEAHDPKAKTVILTSPCIKWIKSGQNLKVINLPLGLVPSLNVCRLPSAKSIVISRPANLNQIIIHKETPARRSESLHRNPSLPVPWRGQVTPIVFSSAPNPVVLSISQASASGGGASGGGGRETVNSLPLNSGYSRGVYENFRKWQQYKGLVRRHFSLTPDTEAVACFFIPVLRSLSQFKPQLSTEEGIPLAIQEWGKLSNFDRVIYYEMAEKFTEFELEEQAQRIQGEQVQVQPGISQGVQLVSGVTGIPGKQIVEDPCGKKSGSKGSQRSHKQAKTPPQAGSGTRDQPIPIEAINQYIEVMEALSRGQMTEGDPVPKPPEERGHEELELIRYIEKLCSKDSFISKAEAIIHPEFLSDLLSPHGNMDFPRLMKELEMEEHLSTAELERRRDLTQASIHRPEPADPRPSPDPQPPAPEAQRPRQPLLLAPLDQGCTYSSQLQLLAIQSASDKAWPPEQAPLAPPSEPSAPPLPRDLLREMQGARPGEAPQGRTAQAPVARLPPEEEEGEDEARVPPGSGQPPDDEPPPVRPPFLDGGDAHPSPWAPKDGRDLGEGPGSLKAQGEASPRGPEPQADCLGPLPLPLAPRPLRSTQTQAGTPAPSLSRVRTRQKKRSSDGAGVRRSKRVKKSEAD